MMERLVRSSDPRAVERAAEVERLLLDRAGVPMEPTPAGLRGRIMEGLREAPAVVRAGPVLWPWFGVAAACVALAGVMIMLGRQGATGPAPVAGGAAITSTVPLEPMGMIRMVAGSVDGPMMDQADAMLRDTRRATRMVVGIVPFAGRGG